MKFAQRRDYYAGALMVLVGTGAAVLASRYPLGTLTRMGPGFFPLALGILLAVIGILIAATATATPASESKEAPIRVDWRGWSCIIGAVVMFIALSKYLGLVAAIFACVFVAAMGDRGNSWKQAALLAAGITVFGTVVFAYGLRVQIPMFGGF